MQCDDIRIALSARLDGEETGVPDETLTAHLGACSSCRAWVADATEVTRRVRVTPVDPAPDLAHAVLAAMVPPPRARRAPAAVLRAALTITGVLQVVVALRLLSIGPDDEALHVVREIVLWEATLGIGFLSAAARPHLARGMAPLVALFCVAVVFGGVADLAGGHTTVAAEAFHLVALVGFALLAWLAHRAGGSRGAPRDGLRWAAS